MKHDCLFEANRKLYVEGIKAVCETDYTEEIQRGNKIMAQSISDLTSELSRWADEDKAEAPVKVTPGIEASDYDFSRLETQLTRLNDLLEFYLRETLGYKKKV